MGVCKRKNISPWHVKPDEAAYEADEKARVEKAIQRRKELLVQRLVDNDNTIGLRWIIKQLIREKDVPVRTAVNAFHYEVKMFRVAYTIPRVHPDVFGDDLIRQAETWISDMNRVLDIEGR